MSMFDAFVVCDLVHNTSGSRERSKVLRVTGTQCEANMIPYLGSNRLTPCLCASFLDLPPSFGFSQFWAVTLRQVVRMPRSFLYILTY